MDVWLGLRRESYQASLEGTYKDGTTNTLGVTEAYGRCASTGTLWAHEIVTPDWHAAFNDWTARGVDSKFQVQPTLAQCNPQVPQQIHSGGMNIMLLDGSVKTVTSSIAPLTWAALLTPAGREVIGNDW